MRISKSVSSIAIVVATLAGAATTHVPVSAQEVVQQLPDPAQAELTNALQRLSRNPENLRALTDAGHASLALGDYQSALGFFNRAQRVDPEDGRMLVGLAQVAVRRGEGATAVQLFDNANAAGQAMSPVAAERGLAYDLIGNNARAQRLYRQALSGEENDEIIRRLALSYAIAGDAAASEATLLPLLQRQDRAGYRTRAFALAILGRDEEAIAIAETMLPPRISGRLAPYLRYMPRLTRAQQAAAANLGRFPPAAEIGQDTPQIAALAEAAEAVPARSPSASERLTPQGAPLGPPPPQAARDANGELPAISEPQPVAVEQPVQQPVTQQPAVQQPPAPPPRARSPIAEAELSPGLAATREEQARPSFSLTENEPTAEPTAEPPAPASPAVEAEIAATEERTEEQLGLEEAFADFVLPGNDLPVAPANGAVDITSIEPAREPEPEPAPPPPPAHPSRIWVQVATGQDVSAFRFDWRRLVRNSEGLLDGRDAFTAPWNSTNRLLTGPFDSVRAANQFVTELGEAGVDAFRFTSSEGEEISSLD